MPDKVSKYRVQDENDPTVFTTYIIKDNDAALIGHSHNVATTSNPGFVPAATSADSNKFLKGDGTWGTVSAAPSTNVRYKIGPSNTTTKPKLNSNIWSPKTWSGLTSFNGNHTWSDGSNIYYSNGTTQKILDKATSTWNDMNWGDKYPAADGRYVYSIGYDIWYNDSNGLSYRLDLSTMKWANNPLSTIPYGVAVWSDGNNVYYSYNSNQYVLDYEIENWVAKSWGGATSFLGYHVWTDGDNIYYSQRTTHAVLNKTSSTWTAKTWTGLTDFNGQRIWTDGENIYYSNGAEQYVLNKATSTWTAKTWSGLTSFTGSYVWSDGSNIYYSSGTDQYVLNKLV